MPANRMPLYRPTFRRIWLAIVTLAALAAIAVGLWPLADASTGLTISRTQVGTIPITVFAPAAKDSAPVVVIAHGFAGSQQFMQPFAVTLARNGYLAVTFDFPGHARNPVPLPGGRAPWKAQTRALLGALDRVTNFARHLPGSDRRLALLGHSMGADVVVRYGRAHPEVKATVGVSLFAKKVAAARPLNLLVIYGALEPELLIEQGYRIVGAAADGTVREAVTYGSFADGTARRLALADGVEHIGVLYSRESMAAARDWLNAVFARHGGDGFLDARGAWLGLLYLGLIALTWPLAQLLPQLAYTPRGAGFRWRVMLPMAILPALLTPLILWRLPSDFLSILLGDYLLLHFALYGLLTAVGIGIMAVKSRRATKKMPSNSAPPHRTDRSPTAFALAAAVTAAYALLAFGLPTDRFITSFVPGPQRVTLVLAMLIGTLPYFAADEWLTRGADAARGAYPVTKLCFLLSLALAIALNTAELFFLVIIVPAILMLFVIFGLLSRWVYQRTNHPLVAALANALVFAWAIAVTFPLVD